MRSATGANVQDENGIILLNVLADDSLNAGGFLNGGNAYTLVEEIDACSLILVKKDEAGALLSGVSFQLDRLIPTTGTWEAFQSGTTDSNGRLVFEDLVYGTYRVTELSTGDGTSLLKEPIVVSLPGAEGNDVVLDVTNAALLAMPFTGGLGTTPFLLCGVTIMLCAAIIWLNINHRDKRKL